MWGGEDWRKRVDIKEREKNKNGQRKVREVAPKRREREGGFADRNVR